MITADTSAIIAVLTGEAERQTFSDMMTEDGQVLVSTATAEEVLIVSAGKGDHIYQHAVRFLQEPFIILVPPDRQQMWAAGEARIRYGKGRHPAGLNFGDTFAYALASVRNLPLLFKGNDFAQTDLTPAV